MLCSPEVSEPRPLFGPLPGPCRSQKVQPGPPKKPKIMAQYPKIESIGSIGSIILAILEVQEVRNVSRFLVPNTMPFMDFGARKIKQVLGTRTLYLGLRSTPNNGP